MFRSFIALLAVIAAPLVIRAADVEHPYKNLKVGDFIVYKTSTNAGGKASTGKVTQTVSEKTDKEVAVMVVISFDIEDGKTFDLKPMLPNRFDLTKPLDVMKATNLPSGENTKVQKLKEGTEKLKVLGKEHETTWTTYKVTHTAPGGMTTEMEAKIWISKDVPFGIAKSVVTGEFGGQKTEATLEVAEIGTKK